MKKIDFMAKYKIFVIIALLIVVVGTVILSVFGFNKGYDISNAYEVDIKVSESLGNSGEQIALISEEVFDNFNLNYLDKKVIRDGQEIVYTFNKNVNKVVVNALVYQIESSTAIPESIRTSVEVSANQTVANYDMSKAWYALLIVGCAIILSLAYITFRYKLANALTLLCSFVVSVLLQLAVIAFTRIPVTNMYLTVITAVTLFVYMLGVWFVSQTKESLKLADENKNYANIANDIINKNLIPITVILGIVLISFVVLMIVGNALLKYFALQVLASAIISVFTFVAVIPQLWYLFRTYGDKIIKNKKNNYKKVTAEAKEEIIEK